MSENIEEIKAFYQDCNKLLKDITIEWIKENGSIGETIKGNEVLEYVDKINQKSYGNNEEYGISYDKSINIRYKCLKDIYNFKNQNYHLIGFQSLKNDGLELRYPTESALIFGDLNNNSMLCGTYNTSSNRDYNIYANHKEYKEVLQDKFIKSNNHILTIITMVLNCIDFKFYKFDNGLFINSTTNIFNSLVNSNKYTSEQIYYKNIQPFYKTLQVKYNTDIIFKMTINSYKKDLRESDIFNCNYKINNKTINFNLIDFYNDSIIYYNNYYHNPGNCPGYFKFYKINNSILNHPYGHRVFYNVIYSLENKLINQISETSKNQEFINNQNYNNQLLQKNQEIIELKRLLQEKSNFNEIQDNLIKTLTETLNTFKEKYEKQLKIHQTEFEKLKTEHIEKYNISLKEFNNNSEEIRKLIDINKELKQENEKSINKLKEENETNKQKLDEILSENLQLKEENETFNKEILEIIQIYNENFNHINKISKTDLIQLKETLTRILDNNINLNNKLKQKEEKINKLQERINKLHNQNDKLNDEIERLKSETQKMNSYKKQLIDISKDILNLQTDI